MFSGHFILDGVSRSKWRRAGLVDQQRGEVLPHFSNGWGGDKTVIAREFANTQYWSQEFQSKGRGSQGRKKVCVCVGRVGSRGEREGETESVTSPIFLKEAFFICE